MRMPSYRRHSTGQARVTINGKDHLLGTYGSKRSRELYKRLIAEYKASGKSKSFGKPLQDVGAVMLVYLRHCKTYYPTGTELANIKLAMRPVARLYRSLPINEFGPKQYKALRDDWLSDNDRSRQYVNKQMRRVVQFVKWAVSEGLCPPAVHQALKCVEPLKAGRCNAKEANPVLPVDLETVERTLPLLTPVVGDMVRFQLLTACRPGEVCKLTPEMVDRSKEVWEIRLVQHKTAHRGKKRVIFVGPEAQKVLLPYLLRPSKQPCFSPKESEQQRRAIVHAARTTPLSCGNKPGSKQLGRKPRKELGEQFSTQSYGKSIKYACQRNGIKPWAPNQLRHSRATDIRKEYGIEAAQVILGHARADVTQVYAERDAAKAVEIAKQIG